MELVEGGFFSLPSFQAHAVGSSGRYVFAESRSFICLRDIREAGWRIRERHDELIALLTEDGWEPVTDRGQYWWQLRFQREED